jgi:hypothetical protein
MVEEMRTIETSNLLLPFLIGVLIALATGLSVTTTYNPDDWVLQLCEHGCLGPTCIGEFANLSIDICIPWSLGSFFHSNITGAAFQMGQSFNGNWTITLFNATNCSWDNAILTINFGSNRTDICYEASFRSNSTDLSGMVVLNASFAKSFKAANASYLPVEICKEGCDTGDGICKNSKSSIAGLNLTTYTCYSWFATSGPDRVYGAFQWQKNVWTNFWSVSFYNASNCLAETPDFAHSGWAGVGLHECSVLPFGINGTTYEWVVDHMNPNPASSPTKTSPLGTAGFIGIVGGGAVLIVAVSFLVYFFGCRKRGGDYSQIN